MWVTDLEEFTVLSEQKLDLPCYTAGMQTEQLQ